MAPKSQRIMPFVGYGPLPCGAMGLRELTLDIDLPPKSGMPRC